MAITQLDFEWRCHPRYSIIKRIALFILGLKFFLFFYRRKVWRKFRISKVGYWNLLPHSFDTPLLYRERKHNLYPVLPCINVFCIKILKMKYTVCRDLKSDHESLVERHCMRGWTNNPFAKKERTYSWKEKKKFPSNNNGLNEYFKILPG